jgi:putative tryptophan/tyrosine transport system substrate-binding protein
MRRREFVTLLGGAMAGSGLLSDSGEAQSPKGHRIALLSATSSNESPLRPFREALRDLGYGENDLVIEARWADGHNERLAELARELVQLAPDVIVTGSSAAALAAKRATSTIPIVTAFTADPVGSGLASSIARPGGNVTGLSNIQEDTAGKELELLKTAAPHVSRVALVINPTNPSYANEVRGAQDAAKMLQVDLVEIEIRTPEEVEGALVKVINAANALLVLADPLFTFEAARIAAFAASNKLPAVYGLREHVAAGGLMSYGPDRNQSFRQAATFVDKILKGAKPADLPFERPIKFELVINLKTAKALGLAIPQSLLVAADELIE